MNENTKKTYLKIPTWSDMIYIRKLWSDPETMAPVGGTIILTDEQAQRWFERMVAPGNPRDYYRLICVNENQPVGEISFHRWKPDIKAADFNIKIHHKNRGQGYARKAMISFFKYYFNEFGGSILNDGIGKDNILGQRALSGFGFEHDPSVKDVYMLFLTSERFNTLYGDF